MKVAAAESLLVLKLTLSIHAIAVFHESYAHRLEKQFCKLLDWTLLGSFAFLALGGLEEQFVLSRNQNPALVEA